MSSAAVMTLPPEPRSVGAARRFVQHHCDVAHLDADSCENALLLTSELVTNAVLHGRSELSVEFSLGPHRVHVAVVDENSRLPVPVPEDRDALDGRGLVLVRAISSAWGVQERGLSKAVWFELRIA
ncbi:MAG: ATP-binding protein [Actinomycetota bacterium]|nr:ATP-binding protein [Actinomycetota bacterium]